MSKIRPGGGGGGGGAPSVHTHAHSDQTGVTANQHHNQKHPIDSGGLDGDHLVDALHAGKVLTATGLNSFGWEFNARGNTNPAIQGLKGWTTDPIVNNAAVTPVTGVLYLQRWIAPRTEQVTNLHSVVTTAGAGFSAENALAMFNLAGAEIASTADLAVDWSTVGAKTHPLVAPVSLVKDQIYLIATLANATTPPVMRGLNVNGNHVNANLVPANGLRAFSIAAQAAIPTSINLAGTTAPASTILTFWTGLS